MTAISDFDRLFVCTSNTSALEDSKDVDSNKQRSAFFVNVIASSMNLPTMSFQGRQAVSRDAEVSVRVETNSDGAKVSGEVNYESKDGSKECDAKVSVDENGNVSGSAGVTIRF